MNKYCGECDKEKECYVCEFSLDDMHNYQDFEEDELMSTMMNFGSLFNMIMTSKSAMQRIYNE